jgi:hypothetical protein
MCDNSRLIYLCVLHTTITVWFSYIGLTAEVHPVRGQLYGSQHAFVLIDVWKKERNNALSSLGNRFKPVWKFTQQRCHASNSMSFLVQAPNMSCTVEHGYHTVVCYVTRRCKNEQIAWRVNCFWLEFRQYTVQISAGKAGLVPMYKIWKSYHLLQLFKLIFLLLHHSCSLR